MSGRRIINCSPLFILTKQILPTNQLVQLKNKTIQLPKNLAAVVPHEPVSYSLSQPGMKREGATADCNRHRNIGQMRCFRDADSMSRDSSSCSCTQCKEKHFNNLFNSEIIIGLLFFYLTYTGPFSNLQTMRYWVRQMVVRKFSWAEASVCLQSSRPQVANKLDAHSGLLLPHRGGEMIVSGFVPRQKNLAA